jgi:ketosteroid isomerase-like protein
MTAHPADTESVVRHHLAAFLEQRGLDAILGDYADDAFLLSEGGAFASKAAIRAFFEGFLAALPAGAIDRFSLRHLRVQADVAYITWSVGAEMPLGTDTFVVRRGKIVAQTFAMHAPASP